MSYFDAQIGRCEALHIMVMTDQTADECKEEHGCSHCTQSLGWCVPDYAQSKPEPTLRVLHRRTAEFGAGRL